MKFVPPSVHLTAFNCPNCGALAQQFWSKGFCERLKDNGSPHIITKEEFDKLLGEKQHPPILLDRARKLLSGIASTEKSSVTLYNQEYLLNVYIANCYNCKNISIWVRERMIYPPNIAGIMPANVDMPAHIRLDYDEARAILDISPRGAAALLRLAIQKLCKELGQKGKNINDDIAALVKSGLDARVQQALDIVRVIGNASVHPGQIDMRDDRSTAEALFKLVNLIVEKTISEPRHIADMYGSLPQDNLDAIKKRDDAPE